MYMEPLINYKNIVIPGEAKRRPGIQRLYFNVLLDSRFRGNDE